MNHEGNQTPYTPLEDLLVRYGVMMHRRFHENEKRRFLVALSKEFSAYGYETEIVMKKVGPFKVRNLYIGNPEQAKTIITTYYDTPAIGMPQYKNIEGTIGKIRGTLMVILPTLFLAALGFAYIFFIGIANWQAGWLSFPGFKSIAVSLLIFGLLMRYRRGIGIRRNFIQNTSGILAMLDVAQNISRNDHKDIALKDVAFAVTDFGIVSHLGERLNFIQAKDPDQKKNYIRLDSVGAAGEVYVYATPSMKRRINEPLLQMETINEKDRATYKTAKTSLIVTAGHMSEHRDLITSRKPDKEHPTIMMDNIKKAASIVYTIVGGKI